MYEDPYDNPLSEYRRYGAENQDGLTCERERFFINRLIEMQGKGMDVDTVHRVVLHLGRCPACTDYFDWNNVTFHHKEMHRRGGTRVASEIDLSEGFREIEMEQRRFLICND